MGYKEEYSKRLYIKKDLFLSVEEISKLTNLKPAIILKRINNGIEGEKLLESEIPLQKYDVGNGQKMTVIEISIRSGFTVKTIFRRIKKGITGKKLISENLNYKEYDVGNNRKMTIPEIADYLKIPYEKAEYRIRNPHLTGELLLIPEKDLMDKKEKIGRKRREKFLKKYDVGNGQKMTAKEIADKSGILQASVYGKLSKGISGEEILSQKKKQPGKKSKLYRVEDGRMMTVKEIAKELKISDVAVRWRINNKKEILRNKDKINAHS